MSKKQKKDGIIKKATKDIGFEMSEKWKRSALGHVFSNFNTVYKQNKYFVYIECGITYLLSVFITGLLVQFWMWITGSLESIKVGLVSGAWFYKGKFLSLIVFLILNYYFWYLGKIFIKSYTLDEERNIKQSIDGTYGTNSQMTEKEKKDALVIGNIWDIKWNIYGLDREDDDIVYALKNQYGMNNNMSVTGTPGSGKSTGLVIPIIMQTVRREESLIITDPKGELYEQTSEMLRAHGYTVKLLNFGPRLMMHSDSCHFMKVIGKSTIMAHTFARTVIENITDGEVKSDIWGLGGLNLLKGAILYVNMSSDYKEKEKTLATVYNLLAESSVEELEILFENLPMRHPAKKAFNIYSQGDKVVKGNTLTGLSIQLSVFQDEMVCKLTSVDDIQFTEPGKTKCMYFVGSSDQEDSMDFLKALFFSLEYQELVTYADDSTLHPEIGKRLPVKVTMLLDEFPNCGIIPNFEKKLSTVRSRNIDTVFITQDLCQLQNMYPDNRWRTVLNDCSSKMLLQTDDEETASFFETRSGTMTAVTEGKRFSESEGDILKIHPEYTVTESMSEREVFKKGDIFTMDINELILSISTHNLIKLRKYNYWSHPMYVEVGDEKNHPDILTPISNHVPKWVRELEDDELELFDLSERPVQTIPEDGSRVTPINMDDENSPARIAAMATRAENGENKLLNTISKKAKTTDVPEIHIQNEDDLVESNLLESIREKPIKEEFKVKVTEKVKLDIGIDTSIEGYINSVQRPLDSPASEFNTICEEMDDNGLKSKIEPFNDSFEKCDENFELNFDADISFITGVVETQVENKTVEKSDIVPSETPAVVETPATPTVTFEPLTPSGPVFEKTSIEEIEKESNKSVTIKKVGKYSTKRS